MLEIMEDVIRVEDETDGELADLWAQFNNCSDWCCGSTNYSSVGISVTFWFWG